MLLIEAQAETEEGLAGYACAGVFNPRAAYQHVAEVTVYLREDCRGRGLGRQLYQALEALLPLSLRPEIRVDNEEMIQLTARRT